MFRVNSGIYFSNNSPALNAPVGQDLVPKPEDEVEAQQEGEGAGCCR